MINESTMSILEKIFNWLRIMFTIQKIEPDIATEPTPVVEQAPTVVDVVDTHPKVEQIPQEPNKGPEPDKVKDIASATILALRTKFGFSANSSQANAVTLLLDQCRWAGITDRRKIAYILATCYHECRFKSIPEMRAKKGTEVWIMQERYWHTGYFGRGFSQLTWKANYEKFSDLLGVDLVGHPELALVPEIGAKILVLGMNGGLFSGVGLSRYFTDKKTDWVNARKIVNGTFQADKVAEAAKIIYAKIKNI
jgi:predicted chitinase